MRIYNTFEMQYGGAVMEFITFDELSRRFFNITNMFVSKQTFRGKTRFIMDKPRPTDAFLYFAHTNGICYRNGREPLYIPCGSVVYMPQNSHYIWENSPSDENGIQENILFEFTLTSVQTTVGTSPKYALNCSTQDVGQLALSDCVTIISVNHSALYRRLFYSLLESFTDQKEFPLTVCRTAYEIFDTLSQSCRSERSDLTNARIIKESIHCLEECEKITKSIKDIADDCNISVSYYERLFKKYAGISPNEYRNIHRINHIKMLLQNKETTLEEIAIRMGYCDSGYLCRFFKQRTGMTPTEYRHMYASQTNNT